MLWTILDPPKKTLTNAQKNKLKRKRVKRRRKNVVIQAKKKHKPVGRALRALELKIRQENRRV